MASLDFINLTILFGALLVLAGILSSLVAMRFGAPLLVIFLLIGMLASAIAPAGYQFNDVHTAYAVGSLALGLILFDGGLRTRMQAFRNVLAPAGMLATFGVLITAALVAPVAALTLGLGWAQSLLMGTVIASTDAAAVFFLMHSRGLRIRPRVSATLEVESGTNDPFTIFLTVALIELLLVGHASWLAVAGELAMKGGIGLAAGLAGAYAVVFALNRFGLPQGLHAPFVATAALVVFGAAEALHGSGYLAAYVAGLMVGNRPTRAHNTVIDFLDAVTWLAQIAMFVILGLLAWPLQLPQTLWAALAIAATLMLVARPAAVFACLAPFRFSWREKAFMSWVGLRGAVGIFLASIPLMVGLPNANTYFDVAFVVVLVSLLVQGWTLALSAHRLHVALPRAEAPARRVELDLPGQLEQELVGYLVRPSSLYLRRHLIPSWARLTLVVRDEQVFPAAEAGEVRAGDHVYFLAPPDRARALDRFFVNAPAPAEPDQRLLGDFYVAGDVTLSALSEIYGVVIASEETAMPLSDFFRMKLGRAPHVGDRVALGPIQLIADRVEDGRVTTVGLDLADPDPEPAAPAKSRPASAWQRIRAWFRARAG